MSSKRNKMSYRVLGNRTPKATKTTNPSDENTLRYYHDIGKCERLSQEEEQEIILRIKSGDADTPNLKTRLVRSHQPFVIMFAKRHCPQDSDVFLDLVQEGNYGMLMALENFDINANVKFITYANSWIMKYILKFLETDELIQRNNRSKTFAVETKIREQFIKENGYEPSLQELMDAFNAAGISIKNKEDLEPVTVVKIGSPLPPSPGIKEDDKENLTIDYGEETDIMEKVDLKLLARNIGKVLQLLTDDEAKVIRKRFGFDGIEEDTAAIAIEMGESVYKVKGILMSGLKKVEKNRQMFE